MAQEGAGADQDAKLRLLFDFFDENRNGEITTAELGIALRSLGHNPTESEVEGLMRSAACRVEGVMQFDEFKHLMTHELDIADRTDQSSMLAAFKLFDTQRTGRIPVHVFRDAMMTLGKRLSAAEVDKMIVMSDIGKTGYINYAAFIEMVHNAAANTNFLRL